MSEQKVPRSVEQRIVIKERHSSPYCCWSLWWISADGTFSPTRDLITMRCPTLRGTFCSLITLATPRQDWTGSNPSRREGGDCGFTLSRSNSCCAVRLVYIQISPGHIWTTLYKTYAKVVFWQLRYSRFVFWQLRYSRFVFWQLRYSRFLFKGPGFSCETKYTKWYLQGFTWAIKVTAGTVCQISSQFFLRILPN